MQWPDLKGKTVLDLSAGNSANARQLAAALIAAGGGRLIINDIQARHFEQLKAELSHPLLELQLLRSSAVKTAGLAPTSVDLAVCSYSLAAIDAIHGQAVLALARLYALIQPGGMLMIHENLPAYMAASAMQQLWAEQAALLSAAQTLSGAKPPKAYQPEVLEGILSILGYTDIETEDALEIQPTETWWPDFERDLLKASEGLDEATQHFLLIRLAEIRRKASELGAFERPVYHLSAFKPWRSLE